MNHLLFQHKPFLSVALAATLLSGLTSCQDEDFGYTAEQIKYAKNFTQTYGDIPADKSWDLSSSAGWSEPIISGSSSLTRATCGNTLTEGTHYEIMSDYTVPSKLLNWMTNQLVEGNDNRYLGSHFVLQLPKNSDFAIIPIFQGASAIMSELEVKINGYDIASVWRKSDNMTADGKKLGYFDGWSEYDVYKSEYTQGTYPLHAASTIGAGTVTTKPIYFHKDKILAGDSQTFMYLSLHNIAKLLSPVVDTWKNVDGKWVPNTYVYEDNAKTQIATTMWDANNEWTTVGDRLTSIHSNGYMLALTVPWENRPTATSADNKLPVFDGKPTPSQVLIIGCEDANGAGSDHDVNDVVFMIVGYPEAPQVVPVNEVIKKRYMCEDLGATDDFDFNDVVVDVTQTMEYELVTTPSNSDSFEGSFEINQMKPIESSKKQTAKIVHLCGTLPLQVRVGNLFFPKINDPTDLYNSRNALGNGQYYYSSNSADYTRAAINYDVANNGGWNPNAEVIINDNSWNPATNNIKVYVDWTYEKDMHISEDFLPNSEDDKFADFSNGNYKVVNFPKPGSVPYIIATDQDIPWMKERTDIPESWVTGNLSDHTGAAGPGSLAVYEHYGTDAGEALLWTGSVRGQAYSTYVELTSETYIESFKEAVWGTWPHKFYNIINVYTKPMSDGSIGRIGLVYPDGEWKDLCGEKGADSYLQGPVDPSTGLCKTSIMLSSDQCGKIRDNGLIVTARSNGIEIVRVSLSRIWDDGNHETGATCDGSYQTGKKLSFSKPSNGTISINDRQRDRMPDDPKYGIPFEEAIYPYSITKVWESHGGHEPRTISSKVTITANADAGYIFKQWSDGNTMNPRILEITSDMNLTAEFELAPYNPNIYLVKEEDKDLTLDIESYGNIPYTITVNSDNQSSPYTIGEYDNRFIRVEYDNTQYIKVYAVGVGTTEFTIQQPAGIHDGKKYGASDVINIRVEVTKVPTASINLTTNMMYNWTSDAADAQISSKPTTDVLNLNQATTNWMVYGAGNNVISSTHYVDLSSADVLIAKIGSNTNNPEFHFNKKSDNSELTIRASSPYVTVYTNADDTRTFVIDLKKIREDNGYAHLNAVTAEWEKSTTVISLKIDKYDNGAKETSFITSSICNETGANWEDLSSSNFKKWNSINVDSQENGSPYFDMDVTKENKNGYGNSGVYYLDYAKLDQYDVLKIALKDKDGTARFLFNRSTDGGSLFEINSTANNEFIKKDLTYGDSHNIVLYYVNLKSIREKFGYIHLNAIKTTAELQEAVKVSKK